MCSSDVGNKSVCRIRNRTEKSNFTDMVGAKPLGLTVAWINRRGVTLSPDVPPPDYTVRDIASVPASILSGSKVNSKVKSDT